MRDIAGDRDNRDLPLVGASISTDDGETYVTVTNLDCREDHSVEISAEGVSYDEGDVHAEILFADQDPALEVTADNADAFSAEPLAVSVEGDSIVSDLPQLTVAVITID